MQNRAAVLTIGDEQTAGVAEHLGSMVIDELPGIDAALVHREIVSADGEALRRAALTWIGRCDLLLVLGGGGVGPDDITPDSLGPLVEKPLPGFGELMRARLCAASPDAATGRWGAGVAGKTLVIWMPGTAGACKTCLDCLAPAIMEVRRQLRQL